MSIFTRTRPPVKPTRHVYRPTRPFGEGVLPDRNDRSERRMPYTAADLQWNAENSPANREGYDVAGPSDAAIDFAAGCALTQARLDTGYPLF